MVCQDTVRALLDHGAPFVSPDAVMDRDLAPLIELAEAHTIALSSIYQIPDKFALLLQRGANPRCHDQSGDTCLHFAMRYHLSDREFGRVYQNPVHPDYDGELKDILMLLLTAGADVYARNDMGTSPSDIAWQYNHWREWTDALKECGYDIDEVDVESEDEATCWTSGADVPTRRVQPKLLGFAEYLEIRKSRMIRHVPSDEIDRLLRESSGSTTQIGKAALHRLGELTHAFSRDSYQSLRDYRTGGVIDLSGTGTGEDERVMEEIDEEAQAWYGDDEWHTEDENQGEEEEDSNERITLPDTQEEDGLMKRKAD